ncbi:MAG: tyrosine-type recombinase/integrase [Dehalococcoidales bacterium]|jgi:integrase/recombinase XerD
MRLSKAWESYAADKRLLGYSPHTLKSYRLQVNLLIRHLGDIDIEEITLEQLKAYLGAQDHLKPASIGHRIRFIRSLFHWALDEGYASKNPASKLMEPKLAARIPKALSEESVEMLREGCSSPLEHAMTEFFYTSGCRVGEVYGLNYNAIDWESRSVIVFGKGSKEREVYFTIKCNIWMKKYISVRKDRDRALFVTERAPHRMSIPEMRHVIKRIAKRAGLPSISPHTLRHTYATHLLNSGAPLEIIQSLMGHSKLETTRIYTHLSGPRRRELYRQFFR